MTTAYIIAKRYFHGDLIAYLRQDKPTGQLSFTAREPIDALFYPDRADAERDADAWRDYWSTKGYPGLIATVEEIKETDA